MRVLITGKTVRRAAMTVIIQHITTLLRLKIRRNLSELKSLERPEYLQALSLNAVMKISDSGY